MPDDPDILIPSDGPEAALAGNLGSVTDEEWRAAHEAIPTLRDERGGEVDTGPYVWAPGCPPEDSVPDA